MNKKTTIAAAISLAFTGSAISQTVVYDTFDINPLLVSPYTQSILGLGSLDPSLDIESVKIEFELITDTTITVFAGDTPLTGVSIFAAGEIGLDDSIGFLPSEIITVPATFSYTTDGSNGSVVTEHVGPTDVAAGDSLSALVSGTTTETWTIDGADLATFSDVGELFQVVADTDFSIETAGGSLESVEGSFSEVNNYRIVGTVSYTLVPEPSSALLACTGLIGLLMRRRR